MRVVLLLAVAVFAGCADLDDAPDVEVLSEADALEWTPMEAEMFQADIVDRPVVWTARYFEEFKHGGDPLIPDRDDREIAVTYHGVHTVYDEWAVPVDAHVFRAPVHHLAIEMARLGPAQLPTFHWEVVDMELAFSAIDGELLDASALSATARGFPDDWHPTPMYLGEIGSVLMGFVTTFFEHHDVNSFETWVQTWQLYETTGKNGCPATSLRTGPDHDDRYMACVEGESFVPAWALYNGLGGGVQWTLQAGGGTLLPWDAEYDALIEWPSGPWTLHEPLPLLPGVLIPTSHNAHDAASDFAKMMDAAYLDPLFLVWLQDQPPVYMQTNLKLPSAFGPPAPVAAASGISGVHWARVGQDLDQYTHTLFEREGDEGQSTFISDGRGRSRESSDPFRYPTADELPDLTPPYFPQNQYEHWAPVNASYASFSMWWEESIADASPGWMYYISVSECGGAADVLWFSAINGQLIYTSKAESCDAPQNVMEFVDGLEFPTPVWGTKT